MTQAAEVLEPRVVKVSSKRQITIPIEYYTQKNFSEYALITWTENGMEIQPVPIDDDDLDVRVLTSLVDQGYEGEELIQAFAKAKKKVVSLKRAFVQAEEDIRAGRVYEDVNAMMDKVAKKHGLDC